MTLSLIDRGGLLMWPLIALSLLGFIFFVERTIFLHKGKIQSKPFLEGIKNLLRKGRVLEALTLCEENAGSIVSVVKASLLQLQADEATMRRAIQAAALVELPLLERRIGAIAVIAKIAPLLGFLGTVVGLIQAFSRLQTAGPYANSADFAGDFYQALITTAMGLAIAILAHLAYHFLNGRVRALVHDMEWVGNEIIQWVIRQRQNITKS